MLRLVLIALVAVGLASCKNASSAAGSAGAPEAQITQHWVTFFSNRSSTAQKLAVLENGDRYARVLAEVARSSLDQQSSAEVSRVTVHGRTADVTYTAFRGGSPALKDRTGQAVLQDGTWKVSDGTFCSLVSMAEPTPPECAPNS